MDIYYYFLTKRKRSIITTYLPTFFHFLEILFSIYIYFYVKP